MFKVNWIYQSKVEMINGKSWLLTFLQPVDTATIYYRGLFVGVILITVVMCAADSKTQGNNELRDDLEEGIGEGGIVQTCHFAINVQDN